MSGFVNVIPRRHYRVCGPETFASLRERYGQLDVENVVPYDLAKPARMLVPVVPMSPRRRAILTGWIGPRGSAIRAAYHRRRR